MGGSPSGRWVRLVMGFWALRRLCAKHPELIKTVDGRNPAPVISSWHGKYQTYPIIYRGFIHPRWFSRRISEPSTSIILGIGSCSFSAIFFFNRLIGVGEVFVLVYVDFLCVASWPRALMVHRLPETNSLQLKMDGWKTFSFPFGFWPIFRGFGC